MGVGISVSIFIGLHLGLNAPSKIGLHVAVSPGKSVLCRMALLGFMLWAHRQYRVIDEITDKYFSHLSNHHLQNFEYYK